MGLAWDLRNTILDRLSLRGTKGRAKPQNQGAMVLHSVLPEGLAHVVWIWPFGSGWVMARWSKWGLRRWRQFAQTTPGEGQRMT